MGYDQDVWADKLDYHNTNIEDALETTRLVRKLTYDLLKRLPDGVWNNTIVHPEYSEPYSFEKWLRIYAEHPRVHADQIRNNYETWKQTKE